MPLIPIALSAKRRLDRPVASLSNMIFEAAPENQETGVSVIPRPGLASFSDIASTAIRGLAREAGSISGNFLTVASTTAYKVNSSGVKTALTGGTVSGSGSVDIALGTTAAVLCNGTALYSTTGTTLATVSFPDGAGVSSVAFINGYYLAARTDSGRVYFSAVNNPTFAALDYFAAENSPDTLRGVRVVGDEVWLLGEKTVEVWVPSGDSDFPFIRVNGRLFGLGCAGRDTIAKMDTSLFWVGGEVRSVFRTAPQPTRISDETIEQRLRLANVADLHGFHFTMEGHALYVLCMGVQGSWAYDVATQQWSEFKSYGLDYFRAKWSAPMGDGRFVVGDSTTGKLWLLDPSINTDVGGVLSRVISARLEVEARSTRCDNLLLECTVGAATDPDFDPMVALDWSDDEGQTYSDRRLAPLGRQGQRGQRVAWWQLGFLRRPGRIFRWTVTDDVFFSARKARYNEDLR